MILVFNIKDWEGVRIIELPQGFKQNDTTNYLVNNNKLFIMPIGDEDTKFLKLVYEGDTQVYQITDPIERRDMTYEYELQTKLGVAIVTNMKFGVWDMSAGL